MAGFPGSIRGRPAWGPQRCLFRRRICRSSRISGRPLRHARSISVGVPTVYKATKSTDNSLNLGEDQLEISNFPIPKFEPSNCRISFANLFLHTSSSADLSRRRAALRPAAPKVSGEHARARLATSSLRAAEGIVTGCEARSPLAPAGTNT